MKSNEAFTLQATGRAQSPRRGGKVGKFFLVFMQTSFQERSISNKNKNGYPTKICCSCYYQNSVYGKSAEMSIPTHTHGACYITRKAAQQQDAYR